MAEFVTEAPCGVGFGAKQEEIGELFEQGLVHAGQGAEGASVGVDAVSDVGGGIVFYQVVFDHAAGGLLGGLVGQGGYFVAVVLLEQVFEVGQFAFRDDDFHGCGATTLDHAALDLLAADLQ